ncbi:MAG: hypothetical protein AAB229_02155 [Candidatus Hydrogenedentota bacterium]
MKKIFLAVLIGVVFSGMSAAIAESDNAIGSVIAARLDKVHTAVLSVAQGKNFTVKMDVRYATAYHVEMTSASGQEVQVCLRMDKNRTDIQVHGNDRASVNQISDALRSRF